MKRQKSLTSFPSKLPQPKLSRPTSTQATAAPKVAKRSRADRTVVKRLMSLLQAGADTRVRKVKRIRAAVRVRTYENDLKLSIALDRMAQDLVT